MKLHAITSGVRILGDLPAQISRVALSNLKFQNRPQVITRDERVAVKSERWTQARVRWLALTGLLVGTALLRIGTVLVLHRVIKWDEPAYLLLGRNLLRGEVSPLDYIRNCTSHHSTGSSRAHFICS
jgi:hypothetical protein